LRVSAILAVAFSILAVAAAEPAFAGCDFHNPTTGQTTTCSPAGFAVPFQNEMISAKPKTSRIMSLPSKFTSRMN
jgi:hypothetical protein